MGRKTMNVVMVTAFLAEAAARARSAKRHDLICTARQQAGWPTRLYPLHSAHPGTATRWRSGWTVFSRVKCPACTSGSGLACISELATMKRRSELSERFSSSFFWYSAMRFTCNCSGRDLCYVLQRNHSLSVVIIAAYPDPSHGVE